MSSAAKGQVEKRSSNAANDPVKADIPKGISMPAVPAAQRLKESEGQPGDNYPGAGNDAERPAVSAFRPVQTKSENSSISTIQGFNPIQLKGKKKAAAVQEEVQAEEEPQVEAGAKADQLETDFDAKQEELVAHMDEVDETYTSGNIQTVSLTNAPTAIATATTLLGELSDLADSIETRAGEVSAEIEDDNTNEDLILGLSEESAKFDVLVPKTKATMFKADTRVTEFVGMIDLEKDRRAATGAVAAALTALRNLWGSAALAKGHFTKHKGDTGLSTETAYLTRAKELTAKSAGGDILSRARGDGDILFFDKSNGNFAIKSAAGKIRTLFNPSGGKSYYDKQ